MKHNLRTERESKGSDAMPHKPRLKTPDEILNAALAKERQSYKFYAGLAEGCQIDFVKKLIETLKNEEHKHVRMVEDMLTKLRLGHSLV
jgi:rubrerythrin